jgi:hypothetical protein
LFFLSCPTFLLEFAYYFYVIPSVCLSLFPHPLPPFISSFLSLSHNSLLLFITSSHLFILRSCPTFLFHFAYYLCYSVCLSVSSSSSSTFHFFLSLSHKSLVLFTTTFPSSHFFILHSCPTFLLDFAYYFYVLLSCIVACSM